MIILTIGKNSYHFASREEMRNKAKRPVPPKGFRPRTFWFGTNLMAETLVKRFAGDRAASREVAKLLRKQGAPLVFNPPREKWVPDLAALLVSGEVIVTEMSPVLRDVATKTAKVEGPLPVPRKAPVAEKPEVVEAATFPPLNDDVQARALAVAAQAGAPFCEVCSRT